MIANDLKGMDISLNGESHSTNDELTQIIQRNKLASINNSNSTHSIKADLSLDHKTTQDQNKVIHSSPDISSYTNNVSMSHIGNDNIDFNIKDEILNDADLGYEE